jgi:hypothetical protein
MPKPEAFLLTQQGKIRAEEVAPESSQLTSVLNFSNSHSVNILRNGNLLLGSLLLGLAAR